MTDAAREPGRPLVRISSTRHRVTVVAEDRSRISLEGEADLTPEPSRTTVDTIEGEVVVRVPERSDIVAGSTSGRITVVGPVGHVAITTESGRVTIGEAISIDVRTDSSGVEVTRVESECRVRTRSGRVQVGYCGGRAELATKTGRIELRDGNGPVAAHCASGRIEVNLDSANDVRAETISGRIVVSLPAGVRPYRRDEEDGPPAPPPGYDCTVMARSVTGRVTIDGP